MRAAYEAKLRASQDPEDQDRLRIHLDKRNEKRRAATSPATAYPEGPRTGRAWIGIDTQARTDSKRRDRCAAIHASDGTSVVNEAGLPPEVAFEFLLRLAGTGAILASFRFVHDVDCLLAQRLSRAQAEQLWQEKHVTYVGGGVGYALEWLPGKRFAVSRLGPTGEVAATANVWDLSGFVQAELSETLSEWDLPGDDGTPARRAELIALFGANLARAISAEGITVRRYEGAGSIAGSLLAQHKIENGNVPDECLYAYYAGRTQAFRIGSVSPAYHYDINSCYPHVMSHLPSMVGKWQSCDPSAGIPRYSLWHVSWDLGEDWERYPLTPFPWRSPSREILYPSSGEGWYWSPLVQLAMRLWPGRIKLHRGISYTPGDPRKPFAWINDLYARRQAYRANGDPRKYVLKFGLNALYGKLSQGQGWKGAPPRWRNWAWAGMITAGAQARLLRAAAQLARPEHLIAMSTDSIWRGERLPELVTGTGLGEWREEEHERLFLTSPTCYSTVDGDEEELHTSGFREGEYPQERILTGYLQAGWQYQTEITQQRYTGLGVALAEGNLDKWGHWRTERRSVGCIPGEGFPGEEIGLHSRQWLPPDVQGALSTVYAPKGTAVIADDVSLWEEQCQPG